MRRKAISNGVTVQAIAGSRGVFFGFDLDAAASAGCLGFALQRQGPGAAAAPGWLAGFKTFKSVVPHPDLQTKYPSNAHPVQSFWWGDYTVAPGQTYTYRVVPVYGDPAQPQPKPGVECTVKVSTTNPSRGKHGVYFNMGVAASQAYTAEFGAPPNQLSDAKAAQAMKWLSRGLDEALLTFIKQASSGGWALRASAFEFTEPGVLASFQAASAKGADVRIVYHAKADVTGDANGKAIATSHIDPNILIPREHAALSHNKFIVLCKKLANGDLAPVSVWTGSTNMSRGGIFGHSNVGHVVRDAAIAQQFLDYWGEVSGDPEAAALKTWVGAHNPFTPADLLAPGVFALFSPRTGIKPLAWFADRFGKAVSSAHITLAFGMTKVLEDALNAAGAGALHFVMLDQVDDHQAVWSHHRGVLVAVGTTGGPDALTRWAKERLTGFNVHVPFTHTKILLIDPLSAHPTVISGSANFSPDSSDANDENMLVINDDLRVADIYVTEYARMFQHFYARYWANKLATASGQPGEGFLVEDATWQDKYAVPGSAKNRQRVLFSSGVAGNVS